VSAGIVFCWVGKTAARYARVGIDEYVGRIERYRPCRVIEVRQPRLGGRSSAADRAGREGEALLERIGGLEPAVVVALDPGGEQIESRELAGWVRRHLLEEGRTVVFVVGGPDGLSSSILARADRLLGLSHLTLPHDMARLILTEQVYRSLTILNGHPYDR